MTHRGSLSTAPLAAPGPLDVAAHPFLAGLPEPSVRAILGCGRTEALDPGTVLLVSGDPADTVHLIHRGRAAVEVATPTGALLVDTAEPGDVVGWSWLLAPHRTRFDVRVVVPSVVTTLAAPALRAVVAADRDLHVALLERTLALTTDRLVGARLRVLDLYGPRR
jgi:CRP-like cAMP-binding protein